MHRLLNKRKIRIMEIVKAANYHVKCFDLVGINNNVIITVFFIPWAKCFQNGAENIVLFFYRWGSIFRRQLRNHGARKKAKTSLNYDSNKFALHLFSRIYTQMNMHWDVITIYGQYDDLKKTLKMKRPKEHSAPKESEHFPFI